MILLSYIIAIPANEIVVPTMMMMYMGAGTMVDGPSTSEAIRDPADRRERMDNVDSHQPDAVRSAPQPLWDNHHDHLQGNEVPQVGNSERGHHAGNRVPGHVPDSKPRTVVGMGVITNCQGNRKSHLN